MVLISNIEADWDLVENYWEGGLAEAIVDSCGWCKYSLWRSFVALWKPFELYCRYISLFIWTSEMRPLSSFFCSSLASLMALCFSFSIASNSCTSPITCLLSFDSDLSKSEELLRWPIFNGAVIILFRYGVSLSPLNWGCYSYPFFSLSRLCLLNAEEALSSLKGVVVLESRRSNPKEGLLTTWTGCFLLEP